MHSQLIRLLAMTFFASLVLALVAGPLVAETVISVPAGDAAAFRTAITTVPDGGIIELAGGVYSASGNPFAINNPGKSFTIRAAAGQTVTLSGGSTTAILLFTNTTPTTAHSVVFADLIFSSGRSTSDGVAGGVTLRGATATFLNCQFLNNTSAAPTTGGGGILAFNNSLVHFSNCLWQNNTAKNEGGGLRITEDTRAYIHSSQFIDNRVNLPGHRNTAAGGGIHVTNARLRVANTRFTGNQAVFGGAIFGYGVWDNPQVAEIIVANSTFVNNISVADPGVTPPSPTVGGALHSEDEIDVFIYNSRFDTNRAQVGGAVSMYRSSVEIHGSTFRGNWSTGTQLSTGGGAVAGASDDANDGTTNFGAINRPSLQLIIRDSLFQGVFGGTNVAAIRGGCVYALGDTFRTYGLGGVPQMGDATVNRGVVEVSGTVFTDCKVQEPASPNSTGNGGAMDFTHIDLTLTNSIIMDCEAVGQFGSGGGLRTAIASDATISNTTFAGNRASFQGGGMIISGSTLTMSSCQFFSNSNLGGGMGSALVTSPEVGVFPGVNHEMSGLVQTTVFSDHATVPVSEVDLAAGPKNGVQYNQNNFHSAGGTGTAIYFNSIAGTRSVAQLNSLVVNRNAGVGNTDKSPANNNVALAGEPDLGAMLAVPPRILATNAQGDPVPPTESSLGFAWASAGAAFLDSIALGGNTTGLQADGSGIHTLEVGAAEFLAEIFTGVIPSAQLTANPGSISGGQSSQLNWTTGGTLLDVTIDRGVSIPLQAAGSVMVTPASTRAYQLIAFTQEGCALDEVKVYVDEMPPIFADGFESGDVSAWSTSVGD